MHKFGTTPMRLVITMLCLSLVLALAACGGDDEDDEGTGAATTSAAKPKVTGGEKLDCRNGAITVGIAKAKSGGAAFFDIAGARGTKIAIDEINASGGIKGCKIKTIEGDTKTDPAVGAQVARSLIDKGAQILLVPDDFDLGIAAARVGQKAGVLTLSLAAGSVEFGKAVGDKFFNGAPTTTQLGEAQAAFSVGKGWKNAYIVVEPALAYFTEQGDAFTALLESEGGKVIGTDKVDSLSGKSDFGSTVSKIKNANPKPDVIMAQLIFPPIGSFVKQLRAAGIDTPVVGSATLQTRELPKLVGKEGSDEIYYAAQTYFEGANVDPESDPAFDKFATAYEEKFKTFPEQANGPGAYQTFHAVNEALQREDVVDAASAAAAVREQKEVEVPGGNILHRWEDGHPIWNVWINGLVDNKFQHFEVVEPK